MVYGTGIDGFRVDALKRNRRHVSYRMAADHPGRSEKRHAFHLKVNTGRLKRTIAKVYHGQTALSII